MEFTECRVDIRNTLGLLYVLATHSATIFLKSTPMGKCYCKELYCGQGDFLLYIGGLLPKLGARIPHCAMLLPRRYCYHGDSVTEKMLLSNKILLSEACCCHKDAVTARVEDTRFKGPSTLIPRRCRRSGALLSIQSTYRLSSFCAGPQHLSGCLSALLGCLS